MPPNPNHPLHRSTVLHPPPPIPSEHPVLPFEDEDGSLVAEYGLLAVLAATIAGLAIKWASGGAIFGLLDAVLTRARVLVGM